MRIDVGEPNKPLQLLDGNGVGPGCHCCDLILTHGDTISAYDVAKELDSGYVELTLLSFDIEVVFEMFQH